MAYDPRQWTGYNKLYDNKEQDAHSASYSDNNEVNNEAYSPVSYYDRSDSKETKQNDIYSLRMVDPTHSVTEYDPCAPAINTKDEKMTYQHFDYKKPDPRKLDRYITVLQKLIRPLATEYKKKLPYDVICQLAHSVLDGTVFEISKGLQDIQKITEKNLSSKRTKLLNQHKEKKFKLKKQHQKDIEKSQSKPHQILVYEKRHIKEMEKFEEECHQQISALDQKLILELDQQMSDQQATLQRAGLPLFYITNTPEDIRLQMYILQFIMKLAAD